MVALIVVLVVNVGNLMGIDSEFSGKLKRAKTFKTKHLFNPFSLPDSESIYFPSLVADDSTKFHAFDKAVNTRFGDFDGTENLPTPYLSGISSLYLGILRHSRPQLNTVVRWKENIALWAALPEERLG